MRAGIDRYTQPSRAQLLDYGKVAATAREAIRYGDDRRADQRV